MQPSPIRRRANKGGVRRPRETMTTTSDLRTALAAIIADYRQGEIAPPDAAHVDRWVQQFPLAVRDSILSELLQVFRCTYFTRENFQTFVDSILIDPGFVGPSSVEFWRGVKILNLQTAGNSQKDMIALLANSLQTRFGLSLDDCGHQPHTYLYLDDALFSGGRIRTDITRWITGSAPAKANLTILVIASHQFGEWDTNRKLSEAAIAAGKDININWQYCAKFENRKTYINNSDILCPTSAGTSPNVQEYIASLGYAPIIRVAGGSSPLGIFSGELGRQLLENEFLSAGVRVRQVCPHFDKYMRPLGRMLFESLGFGSMIVTYRNCPNNTPLALWAGDPWYPLFPRKTN